MAAVLLFWDTNMAAVTSCENTLLKKKTLIQVSNADLHWRSTDAVANDMKSGFLDFRIT